MDKNKQPPHAPPVQPAEALRQRARLQGHRRLRRGPGRDHGRGALAHVVDERRLQASSRSE